MIAGGAVSVNGTRARRVELARAFLIVKTGERGGSTTWRAATINETTCLRANLKPGRTYEVDGDRITEVENSNSKGKP